MTSPAGGDVRAWLELLRVSALLTVPGDALAGAAALGTRPNRGTALALASSLCLYEAGMALNDWADRAEDARDRPHRPIPSGRIAPAAALSAAGALSATGLLLASRAGRPALAAATAVTATVWAYDLKLKHTALAPAAMASARALDLLMGAVATGTSAPGSSRSALAEALSAATLLGAHTYGVTEVSRHEVQGGSTAAPLAVLGAVVAIAAGLSRRAGDGAPPGGVGRGGVRWGGVGRGAARAGGDRRGVVRQGVGRRSAVRLGGARRGVARQGAAGLGAVRQGVAGLGAVRQGGAPGAAAGGPPGAAASARHGARPDRIVACALAAAYLRTAARPLLHAALNPSPPLTQRAVGGGIRAMIPLQAALAARAGAPGAGAALLALAPLARRLARKVSPT
ncbi:SCO3242 family prenyltransferase [Streptomyces sp. NPDC021093]|uniref:SCO3242 family prenyltransferase n=1 Tax=Streptomyces sp. NPDC021093 TaxID=3365112 RepID=UPI0037897146